MRRLTPLVVLVISVTLQAEAHPGFDEICDIYSNYEYNGESVGELWFILGDRVEQKVIDVPALQIYSALKVADQCSRYEVFQEVAEEQLTTDWHCSEMQALLNLAKSEDCG